MAWIQLRDSNYLNTIFQDSNDHPKVIFKHSTRCSLSSLAFNRLNNTANSKDLFLVNVIEDRSISNELVQMTGVVHQSPQLLVIYKESCVYSASHLQISDRDLKLALEGVKGH